MNTDVIEVLRRAVSQDPNVLKSAEQILKQWETQQGFYIALYVSFCMGKPQKPVYNINNCYIVYDYWSRFLIPMHVFWIYGTRCVDHL